MAHPTSTPENEPFHFSESTMELFNFALSSLGYKYTREEEVMILSAIIRSLKNSLAASRKRKLPDNQSLNDDSTKKPRLNDPSSGIGAALPSIRAWNSLYGPAMNFMEEYPLRGSEASQVAYCVNFPLDGQRIWPYQKEDFCVEKTTWACAPMADSYWANNKHIALPPQRHANHYNPWTMDRLGYAGDKSSNAGFSWFPEPANERQPGKVYAIKDIKAGSYLGAMPGRLHYGFSPRPGWLAGPNGVFLQPSASPLIGLILGPRRKSQNVIINYEVVLDPALPDRPSYRFIVQALTDISAGDVLSIGL